MNILELAFEEEVKKLVNEKLEIIDDAVSDELADVYFMLSDKLDDTTFNKIIEKISKTREYIRREVMK